MLLAVCSLHVPGLQTSSFHVFSSDMQQQQSHCMKRQASKLSLGLPFPNSKCKREKTNGRKTYDSNHLFFEPQMTIKYDWNSSMKETTNNVNTKPWDFSM